MRFERLLTRLLAATAVATLAVPIPLGAQIQRPHPQLSPRPKQPAAQPARRARTGSARTPTPPADCRPRSATPATAAAPIKPTASTQREDGQESCPTCVKPCD